jgi:CheY-like chemotaxis protein
VDDDENIRESLQEAFEEEGYSVATASNGKEALAILAQSGSAPDAVVLDLVLPIMDGRQLYRAMQADPLLARIPVIVSTSNPAHAPSGLVVVAKPLKLDRLLETVAHLWEEEPVP